MCDVGVSGVCLLVNKEYCRTGVHWQRTTVQIASSSSRTTVALPVFFLYLDDMRFV
jgi:hypothetical protein